MKPLNSAEQILRSSGKFRIELGLGRIEKILECLGHPERDLKVIHVAGTNGKGSVCAILEEILVSAGFKTGKFTSPHLFSYTERITVNKRPISDLDFENLVNQIHKLDREENIGLTEFEILTAAGFLWFKQNGCDVVVLEVGLGGRLDSTNVIANPIASIITSISLEHTERLGDTIEKIACEKAGIVKKGFPAVILRENNAYETLKSEALRRGGILYEAKTLMVKGGYAYINGEAVPFALKGAFQGENLALALKAIEVINEREALGAKIPYETVKRALNRVKWAFRVEERKLNDNGGKILIDACHNPDGARVLGDYIREKFSKCRIKFVFGCLKNKDYVSVLKNLTGGGFKGGYEFCFYEFDYPNALKYSEFKAVVEDAGCLEGVSSVRQTFEPLKEAKIHSDEGVYGVQTAETEQLTVFCGSIYMLGIIFAN